MDRLTDLTLTPPISDTVLRGLLFGTFLLHMLFLLMMLGTAMLALAYFMHAWWANRLSELRWDKKILRVFLIHKSLAVVLGVGPLLLIQVAYTIPFFTGVTLFGPFWLLIIAFLIVSFLSFDSLGHRIETHRHLHLGLGIIAMIGLLCVPGFFVAVLVTTENPDRWMEIVREGFGFDWRLSVHWLFRYLHVLGAAVVFGAAFHYFFIARRYPEKRGALLKWLMMGLLLQVALGIFLYWSLFQTPTPAIYVFLAVGVVMTTVMVWLAAVGMGSGRSVSLFAAAPVLLTLLAAMLLARQGFQDRAFASIMPQLKKNAEAYRTKLDTYESTALAHYRAHMSLVYNTGPTIYAQSCGFCHGGEARGDGPDAHELAIPPEDIAAVRTDRAYLERIFAHGVDGTAMPRFTYYESSQRDKLITWLNQQYGVLSPPPPVTATVSGEDRERARAEWRSDCAACHGTGGAGTAMSARLQPPPPDFTHYSLTPERALRVITDGYPGTMMSSYGSLGEGERWGLVQIVLGWRRAPVQQGTESGEGNMP